MYHRDIELRIEFFLSQTYMYEVLPPSKLISCNEVPCNDTTVHIISKFKSAISVRECNLEESYYIF